MAMRARHIVALILWSALLQRVPAAYSQQAADSVFRFVNTKPAFPRGTGPRVCMDVAHNNFQSRGRNSGAYDPFVHLLEGDGYRVRSFLDSISSATLHACDLLITAGAYGANDRYWVYPRRSAFAPSEIASLHTWVREGGSLLVITDHTPAPGALALLGERFGVIAVDGLARLRPDSFPDVFARERGELKDHAIFRGRTASERLDSVATFHGTAFRVSDAWEPLLQFSQQATAYIPFADLPRAEWPHFSAAGWLHAAARRMGKGRVIWLGEQSICTALAGQLGMNHPAAQQNAQFCLNAARWLSGVIETPAR